MSVKQKGRTLFRKPSYYGGPAALRPGWTATLVVLGILFIATLITVPIMWVTAVGCRNTANNMSVPHQWAATSGCMIQVDGRWIDIEQYRVVEQP